VDIADVADELTAPASDASQMLDLQRCLLRLPPEQREVLLLVSMEDMSYAEVAKVIGVPIGTVMSRLSRARIRLQVLLDSPIRATEDATVNPATVTQIHALHRSK
jgi:RNA polymerase sigma-70 factor (ECF subfamily)